VVANVREGAVARFLSEARAVNISVAAQKAGSPGETSTGLCQVLHNRRFRRVVIDS